MSTVSYDSQSLMVDGRRLWLTSAAFNYTHSPRLHWRRDLHHLKMQSFNCVGITVPWHHHEPRPGQFDFTGERDLSHLLEIVRDLGLYCTLKAGPYAGPSFAGGGLPAWLYAQPDMKLRESSRPFLDGCARWLAAFMDQVHDFQITRERSASKPNPGPVILMQVEYDWRCQNDQQAESYLAELSRFLREGGCQVPLLEANNGWQTVESAFSIWRGSEVLAATMRQFRAVQNMPPAQQFPLCVSEVQLMGNGQRDADDAVTLAQALSVGAQIEVEMKQSDGAKTRPVQLTGQSRQLTLFAQQFAQLFAHLNPAHHHAAIAPTGEAHELTLLHQHGSQGDVAFMIRSARDKSKHADLLLPDGQSMRVDLGDDRVAWVAFNVNLAGVATLNHTNLRPLAFIDHHLLVLTGPAGSEGIISIDDSEMIVFVPKGQSPTIVQVDAITLVILSPQQADACAITAKALFIGVSGIDETGQVLPHRAFKQPMLVQSDGQCSRIKVKETERSPAAPKMGAWSMASASALIDGSSQAFVDAQPGASLSELAPADRAGFYHMALPASRSSASLLAPDWSDHVTIFQHGRITSCITAKRDAKTNALFALKNTSELALLASHTGNVSDGWHLGQRKGLAGHLYQVKQVKLVSPKRVSMRLPDFAAWRSFLPDVSYQVHPTVSAWSWRIKPAGKHAMIMMICDLPCRVLVVVNGAVVGGYDPVESGGHATITLLHGQEITGGRNRIELVPMDNDESLERIDPRKFVHLYDAAANLTAKAKWRFAPVAPPADKMFGKVKRSGERDVPAWFRAEFVSPRALKPLYVEFTGLSAGQAWLNGHALGAITDQPMHLPYDWLSRDEKKTNALVIFDERGCLPRSSKLRFGE